MKDEAHTNSVMKTMILFSLAMIFFPVFLYFFSKAVIFEGGLMRSNRSKQVTEVHSLYLTNACMYHVHVQFNLYNLHLKIKISVVLSTYYCRIYF